MKWFGARNFVMISFWRLTGGTGMETNMRWFGIKFKRRKTQQEECGKMNIIVGLGNPTREYENTRHNIGFMAIDALAEKYNISVLDCKHKALIGKGVINGNKVVLVKPLTYMNLSGEAVRAVIDYYKADAESELIVIYDDVSLDVGQLRIRKKGSAGGHNGIKNIIAHLGHDVFMRIKIGVGEKPKGYDLADYVLGHFSKDELGVMKESLEKVDGAVNLMMAGEVDKAMNDYNKIGRASCRERV